MIATLLDLTTAPGPAAWLSAGARMFTADPAEVGRYAAQQGSRMDAQQGLLILGGLVAIIGSISLTTWLLKRRPSVPVVFLFNRIARDAGLNASDRRMLYRLSRGHGRAAALAPLLCPGTLGAWARAHARAGTAPRRRRAAQLARAASIRRHLFGPPRAA